MSIPPYTKLPIIKVKNYERLLVWRTARFHFLLKTGRLNVQKVTQAVNPQIIFAVLQLHSKNKCQEISHSVFQNSL